MLPMSFVASVADRGSAIRPILFSNVSNDVVSICRGITTVTLFDGDLVNGILCSTHLWVFCAAAWSWTYFCECHVQCVLGTT